MTLTPFEALLYVPFALPICTYAALSDLRRLRIPNAAVLALGSIFAVIGGIILPLDIYALRWLQCAVVLALGAMLTARHIIGAGDAKLAAAIALYIAPGDANVAVLILATTLLIGLAAHKVFRNTPVRALAPHWASWHAPRRFPMGFVLCTSLLIYLSLAALSGW